MERQEIKKYLERTKYHYYNVVGGGNICVATANNEDRDTIYFGVSFCSPKDKFSKKKGRMEALKRLYMNMKEENILHCNQYNPTVNESVMANWYLGVLARVVVLPNWLTRAIRGKNIPKVILPRKLPKKMTLVPEGEVVLW